MKPRLLYCISIYIIGLVLIAFTIGCSDKISSLPEPDKTAVKNGRIVAERFSRWIAEHNVYPYSDSLIQAIAFSESKIPNVLVEGREMHFCNMAINAGPGDLIWILIGGDHERGSPFAFDMRCNLGRVEYSIYLNDPEIINIKYRF
ncbi:MAG: hypothetical protein V1853_02525 [bacterium]